MLILDRTQRKWGIFFGVTTALATLVYFWTGAQMPNGPSGGSLPGLIFGILAALMMVYAGLLGARRRFPSERLGKASSWMRGHLWIGTLTVPFALFHAGFGLGGGLELGLWFLFFAVILSGFWGLALQNILPKMMLHNISRETFIQQIPYLCGQFTGISDVAVVAKCGPLDVVINPQEVATLEPHLRPFFDEARKKDRTTYNSKTETESAQFIRYLGSLYQPISRADESATAGRQIVGNAQNSPTVAAGQNKAGISQLTEIKPSSSVENKASASSDLAPAMTSVGRMTQSDTAKAATPATSAVKPSVAEMLAAAKAKKAMESNATPAQIDADAASAASQGGMTGGVAASTAQSPTPTAKPKPNVAEMLAAAKAKKSTESNAAPAQLDVEARSAASLSETTAGGTAASTAQSPMPTAKPKPNVAEMLAAAKAKKAMESNATPAQIDADAASAASQGGMTGGAAASTAQSPTPTAKPKPNVAEMLAAAKAKKSTESNAAPAQLDVEARSAASLSETTAGGTAASTAQSPLPTAKPKPNVAEMLAAAKAKKAAEELVSTADPVETTPEAIASTGALPGNAAAKSKPNVAEMLAAAKAKKAAQTTLDLPELAMPDSNVQPVPANVEPTSAQPVPKLKPSVAEMLAVAKAKKLAESSATAVGAPFVVEAAAKDGETKAGPGGATSQTIKPTLEAVKNVKPSALQAVSRPSAEQLADFKKFYRDLIRPFLPNQRSTRVWKEGIAKAVLAARVRSAGEHPYLVPLLHEIQEYCEQRQQFALVQRYHFWLHGWLLVHIPATVALYCILVVHIVSALRVIPFGT